MNASGPLGWRTVTNRRHITYVVCREPFYSSFAFRPNIQSISGLYAGNMRVFTLNLSFTGSLQEIYGPHSYKCTHICSYPATSYASHNSPHVSHTLDPFINGIMQIADKRKPTLTFAASRSTYWKRGSKEYSKEKLYFQCTSFGISKSTSWVLALCTTTMRKRVGLWLRIW